MVRCRKGGPAADFLEQTGGASANPRLNRLTRLASSSTDRYSEMF